MKRIQIEMAAEGIRQCLLLWSVDYWNLEGILKIELETWTHRWFFSVEAVAAFTFKVLISSFDFFSYFQLHCFSLLNVWLIVYGNTFVTWLICGLFLLFICICPIDVDILFRCLFPFLSFKRFLYIINYSSFLKIRNVALRPYDDMQSYSACLKEVNNLCEIAPVIFSKRTFFKIFYLYIRTKSSYMGYFAFSAHAVPMAVWIFGDKMYCVGFKFKAVSHSTRKYYLSFGTCFWEYVFRKL